MASKVPYLCFEWYLTGDPKKMCIYFWNWDINAKLKEKNEKKNDMALNIPKNFATIFDHQLDLFKTYN